MRARKRHTKLTAENETPLRVSSARCQTRSEHSLCRFVVSHWYLRAVSQKLTDFCFWVACLNLCSTLKSDVHLPPVDSGFHLLSLNFISFYFMDTWSNTHANPYISVAHQGNICEADQCTSKNACAEACYVSATHWAKRNSPKSHFASYYGWVINVIYSAIVQKQSADSSLDKCVC